MSVPDHAVPPVKLRVAEDADVSNWLEALAARDCTPDEFLAEILRREREDPDVHWEALALLDQELRRRGISREIYTDLKTRLHQHHAGPVAATPKATPKVAAPMVATRVGDRLRDRYRVVEITRKNATGTLVEAIDEQKVDLPGVRKRVAIMVVDESLSHDRDYLHRVGRLQALSHPAIAALFDAEEHRGALLLVQELLTGPSLCDLMARAGSTRPHASVPQLALRATASALAHAHSRGVVHGDVGAKNIFLTHAGDFRLRGFETQENLSADPAADRRAFAQLAYQVLAGAGAVDPQTERLPLLTPSGIDRKQWRAIRRTLNRKSGSHDVLAVFAEGPARRSSNGWVAAAIIPVVVALGIGGYLYAHANSPEPVAAPAIAPAISRPETAAVPPPVPVTEVPVAAVASVVATPPARARIDLPVRFASVGTSARVARIWVRRRDSLKGAVTFKWWTESGSAKVDRDFRRIEPRIETIAAGASGVDVLVPLIPDPDRTELRTFWVKIDEASRGAILGESTLMQVAVVPPGK